MCINGQTGLDAVVERDRLAVERSIEIVSLVTADKIELPTPCAAWSLGDLLAHMIAQHDGFAAAASGTTTDRSFWHPRTLGGNPAVAYAEAARHVLTAFAARQALSPRFWLPEIRDGGPFLAETAIGFHFLDYVVHGWDVAASLGIAADYPAELVSAALEISRVVPGGAARTVAGASFRPSLGSGAARSELDQLLMTLGRSPSWPQP
jgi:uncharacterized protein (TIGR03086 family)